MTTLIRRNAAFGPFRFRTIGRSRMNEKVSNDGVGVGVGVGGQSKGLVVVEASECRSLRRSLSTSTILRLPLSLSLSLPLPLSLSLQFPQWTRAAGKRCLRSIGGSGLLAFALMRASRSLGDRSAHDLFGGSGSGSGNQYHDNNNNNNNNNQNNGYSAWKFLALAAAMAAAGAYQSARDDENDFDKNERTSDNDWMLTRSNPRHRPSASANEDWNANWKANANANANANAEDLAAHLPVHRTTKHKPRRRDTAFRIQLGDSIVVDRIDFVDDDESSSTSTSSSSHTVAHERDIPLVLPEDEGSISPFLYCLMKQMTLVRIDEHNRELYHNKLPVGLPGIACAHCCRSGRGNHPSFPSNGRGRARGDRCQIFPTDRRTLPSKVRKQLYQHVRSCDRCPVEIKMELERLNRLESKGGGGGNNGHRNRAVSISREERLFFKKLWFRMGHKVEL